MGKLEEATNLLSILGFIQVDCVKIEPALANLELQYSKINVQKFKSFKKKLISDLDLIEEKINSIQKPYQKLGPQGPHKKYNRETGKIEY